MESLIYFAAKPLTNNNMTESMTWTILWSLLINGQWQLNKDLSRSPQGTESPTLAICSLRPKIPGDPLWLHCVAPICVCLGCSNKWCHCKERLGKLWGWFCWTFLGVTPPPACVRYVFGSHTAYNDQYLTQVFPRNWWGVDPSRNCRRTVRHIFEVSATKYWGKCRCESQKATQS